MAVVQWRPWVPNVVTALYAQNCVTALGPRFLFTM